MQFNRIIFQDVERNLDNHHGKVINDSLMKAIFLNLFCWPQKKINILLMLNLKF